MQRRLIVVTALAAGMSTAAAIVTGCASGTTASHRAASHQVASTATPPHQVASHHAARHHAASRAAPPRPVTRAAARQCPATIPSHAGPPGVTPAEFFGWGDNYGNGKLWVGGLGPGPRSEIVASGDNVSPDGSISWKYGWWRKTAGYLTITGRRLDAPAPPATPGFPAGVDSGYGNIGFQASAVIFPSEGCWQVTGKVAHTSLTFVTLVITQAHRGVLSAMGDVAIPGRGRAQLILARVSHRDQVPANVIR